jgi:hypothetical protein
MAGPSRSAARRRRTVKQRKNGCLTPFLHAAERERARDRLRGGVAAVLRGGSAACSAQDAAAARWRSGAHATGLAAADVDAGPTWCAPGAGAGRCTCWRAEDVPWVHRSWPTRENRSVRVAAGGRSARRRGLRRAPRVIVERLADGPATRAELREALGGGRRRRERPAPPPPRPPRRRSRACCTTRSTAPSPRSSPRRPAAARRGARGARRATPRATAGARPTTRAFSGMGASAEGGRCGRGWRRRQRRRPGGRRRGARRWVRLLRAFDPYLLGYAGRGHGGGAGARAKVWPGGGWIHSVVLVDGVGAPRTWAGSTATGRREAFGLEGPRASALAAEVRDVARLPGRELRSGLREVWRPAVAPAAKASSAREGWGSGARRGGPQAHARPGAGEPPRPRRRARRRAAPRSGAAAGTATGARGAARAPPAPCGRRRRGRPRASPAARAGAASRRSSSGPSCSSTNASSSGASRRSCSRSVTPGRRASYQRRGGSAVAAPADRRTRRRPWPTRPSRRRRADRQRRVLDARPRRSRHASNSRRRARRAPRRSAAAEPSSTRRSTSRGPSSTRTRFDDSAARSSPDSRVHDSSVAAAERGAPPARRHRQHRRGRCPGIPAPRRAGAASASSTRSVRQVGQEGAARARAQVLLVLLASRSIATASAARSVATRSKSSSGSSTPAPSGDPTRCPSGRTSTSSAPSGVSPRSSGPVQLHPRRQRDVVTGAAGDVVDELVAGVLQHDRVPTAEPPARRGSRHAAGRAGSGR